jgi:arginine decarboxylase-like protein
MAITISAPHFKESVDDPNIKPFLDQLESFLDLKNIPHYIVKGTSLKTMLDLTTSEARGTSYNQELAAYLKISDLHLELHAYDFDTHEDWSTSDLVIGKLLGYTDEELLGDFENVLGSSATVETNMVVPMGHYASALSEFVYQIPSIVLYVNVDSSQLYPSITESITDIILDYEERKTS